MKVYDLGVGILILVALYAIYVATTLEQKVDHRFKSYDMLFFLERSKVCLDTNSSEVKAYYKTYKGSITPLGKKWLNGEYVCKEL